jgi:hypothetical protein
MAGNNALKGYGWKWPWSNLKYCPGICLERTEENSERTQKRKSMCLHTNLGPLKYKRGTLTAQV